MSHALSNLAVLFAGLAGLYILSAARSINGAAVPVESVPRGIRNNNPGNIEYTAANDWQGQTGSDGRFAIFSSPAYGIRAMARIISNYQARGLNTLNDILTTWAPEHENNTGAYISSVSARSGLAPGEPINQGDYLVLIEAMIYHENGQQPYSWDEIGQGVALA